MTNNEGERGDDPFFNPGLRWSTNAKKKSEVLDKRFLESNTSEFFENIHTFLEENLISKDLDTLREKMRNSLLQNDVNGFVQSLKDFVKQTNGEQYLQFLDLSLPRLAKLNVQKLLEDCTFPGDAAPDPDTLDRLRLV